MKKLLIYGASYHILVKLIDAINRGEATWQIFGFLDDSPDLKGKKLSGYPVIGGRKLLGDLAKEENLYFFSNVGHNCIGSRKITELLDSYGCDIPNLIHPGIDMSYVEIGRGCLLQDGCIVGGNSKIGDFLTTRLGSLISHDVVIENHVFIGPGATIAGRALLKKGCFIGAGVTIMPERTVGEGSVVGAGSLVNKDVPSYSTFAGVPARPLNER